MTDDAPDPLTGLLTPDELDRYLTGQVTAEDGIRLSALSAEHPWFADQLQAIRIAVAEDAHWSGILSTPEAWAQLRQRVQLSSAPHATTHATANGATQERSSSRAHLSAAHSRRWATVAGAAASIAVALLLMIGIRSGTGRSGAHVQEYRTAAGQRSTIHLADGSTVVLGPATSLRVSSRHVDLTGQAYFIVAARQDRPFVVRTTNAVIRVLGTRFFIRRYSEDHFSRVAVEEGRVAIGVRHDGAAPPPRTVISANMVGEVSDSGVTVDTGVGMRAYTEWTHGVLVFQRVTLRDVVAELGRAYGAAIEVPDTTLAGERMRLDVSTTQQSLPNVLDLIGEAIGAHYTKRGETFVLSPGRAKGHLAPGHATPSPSPQPEKEYGR